MTPALFNPEALRPLSGQACRAAGTLRVLVEHTVSCSIPMERDVVHWGAAGAWYFASPVPAGPSAPWLDFMTCFQFQPAVERWTSLRNPQTGEVLDVTTQISPSRPGFLVEYPQTALEFQVRYQPTRLARARAARRLRDFKGEGWQMDTRWYEPEGVVDLPVQIDLVAVPLDKNIIGVSSKALGELRIFEGAAPDEVRRTLAHALFLVHAQEFAWRGGGPVPLDPAWQALLSQVRVEHLPVLLDLTEKIPIPNSLVFLSDDVFMHRLVDLLQPPDIEGLRRRPELFRKLEPLMLKKGLISGDELTPPPVNTLKDAALQAVWERSTEGDDLAMDELEEGIGRGLPWAMAAVAELVDVMPFDEDTAQIRKWMPRWSDCPADRRGLGWLKEKAARLKWDAAAKRWVEGEKGKRAE